MTNDKKNIRKALIADPEPFVRDTLKIKLMSKGYQVALAENGKDMVVAASREKPDIILTEINFKDIDALRACQILKGNSRTKHIPIIILTHEPETPERRFMFNPYIVKFITKPFGLREIALAVKEVLSNPSTE
jgi:DNA-binding response OmpR family regulator